MDTSRYDGGRVQFSYHGKRHLRLFDHRRDQRPIQSRLAVWRCRGFRRSSRTSCRSARTTDLVAIQRQKPGFEDRSQTRHLQCRNIGRGRAVRIHRQTSRGTATTADPERLADDGCGTSSPRQFHEERQATRVRASCGSTPLQSITGGNTRTYPQRTPDGRDRPTWNRQDATRCERGCELLAGRRQSSGDINQQRRS